MRILVAILVTIILSITNNITAQTKTITARVVNITSDTGKVGFALYNKNNFMRTPIQGKESKIKDGKTTVIFKNVTSGEYAIVCYHDKNNNNQMDFASNGMPLEDYGASNNNMSFGPPNYEDAKFTFNDKDVSLEIRF